MTSDIQAEGDRLQAIPRTSSGRVPVRDERRPAIGATKTGMIVHGRVRRPAWSGL